MLSSYTPPTSTTMVQVSRRAGSLVRVRSALHVNDCTLDKDGGLTSSSVRLCEAQQVDRECFIAVKRAVVRANELQTADAQR